MAAGVSATELRELPEEELLSRLKDSKAELFNLRVQAATGQMDSHQRLKEVRREIARIYTIMRERELGLSAAPSEVA
jgi:large subunit ribosomal protein L29